MKLCIVQLSDLHLKTADNPAEKRAENIALAAATSATDCETILVIFSGDFVFSGLKEEYAIAEIFIKNILGALAKQCPGKTIHYVAIPGNHDCDFTRPMATTRTLVLEGLSRSQASVTDENTLELCCDLQMEFFNCLQRIQTLQPLNSTSKAYYEYIVPVGTYSVLVRCFNTALSSSNPELPGRMYFPVGILQVHKREASPDYIVSVMHHPYNWLMPNTKRVFADHIDRFSDLILTGHEHRTAYYRKNTYTGVANEYIEGAVLQEAGDPDSCGFNVIVIDLLASEEKIVEFQWADDAFVKHDISGGWQQYRRSLRHRDFELTDVVIDHLDDPGAAFSHPAKPKLSLEDIYIPPDAEELCFKNGKELSRVGIIKSRNLLATIVERKRVFVIGRERSGKSSLAKMLFKRFYAQGLVPVLIEGDDIKGHDAESFYSVVGKRFSETYKNPLLDAFEQLARNRVVVIIDDLDHAQKINAKGRLKLLENIRQRYDRIVVLGDDLLRYEEITYGELGAKVLGDYTQIEIQEYGYVLRSSLIDKWYSINDEYATNPELIGQKVRHAEALIDDIIRRSYLPSSPIFILTMLQGVDAAQPVDAGAASYGYLYQVLIMDRLAHGRKDMTVDRKVGYLVELAYYIFKKQIKGLSETEFELFHLAYCKDYPSVDRGAIFEDLDQAGILEVYDGQYRFKYPYFYYYFVAQYLARHIEEEEARRCIISLCDHFDREEHSNIWLFLAHQSRAQFLLDTIAGYARSFFSGIAPPKFSEDIEFLQCLYDKVPELVYINKTLDEIRHERRQRLDESGKNDNDVEDTDLDGKPGDTDPKKAALRLVRDLKAAVRTLEIMGQIVKNFAGSMKTDLRYKLVKECYELGLRIVGNILQIWQGAGEQFISEILSVVLEKNANLETKEELEKKIKAFIFYFCETIAFGIVKRISQSVGCKDLTDIYKRVLDENPTNAYKLVDLSVKLDSAALPINDVLRLEEDLRDNIFCKRVLCRLVLAHFHLFKSAYATKQTICGKLGIKMEHLRSIDYRTAAKKRLA